MGPRRAARGRDRRARAGPCRRCAGPLGELYKPDLLLIPIGGGQFVMNPADAALATRELIKPKMALPIHYGTTPALVGTPEKYLKELGSSPVKAMSAKPGDTLEF